MADLKGKDTLMKTMLSNSTLSPPSPAHLNTLTSSVASPLSDSEEGCSKLSSYLSHVSNIGLKENRTPWDRIYDDHNYSRTGDAKVDLSKLRPTKTLFMCKQNIQTGDISDVVDIISVPPAHMPPYDIAKAQQVMDECEKCVSFARIEEGSDDWEENMTRIGWTAPQNTLFNKVVKILHADRLSRLANAGNKNEPIQRRLSVDKSAQRFREAMAGVVWDTRLTQWLHSVLIDNLSTSYLAAYLDILQTLKIKIPTLIDKIMGANSSKLTPVVSEGLNLLLKRPWDPTSSTINQHKLRKLPGNPVIIVVPSGPKKVQTQSNRSHLWNSHLSHLGTVHAIPPPLSSQMGKVSMMNCLDQMMSLTKSKIADIKADYPGRPIILLGWRSGAGLACQMAVTESVSCVVCLGVPSKTVEGKRGEAEDVLLDIKCPILFVIGEKAASSRQEDIECMREKMQVQTGLLIVGGADDYLRMGKSKKKLEGVTQSIVDRCIIEEINDFLSGVLMMPPSTPTRPTPTMYNPLVVASLNDTRRNVFPLERKRHNSTTSSVDSEQSAAKRSRPASPQPATPLSKLGYVFVSDTKKPPSVPATRGRKPGSGKKQQQKLVVNSAPLYSNITSQVTNGTSGGITLNIGSIASLSQVGSLQIGTSTPTSTFVSVPQHGIKMQPTRGKHTSPDGTHTFIIQAGNKTLNIDGKDTQISSPKDKLADENNDSVVKMLTSIQNKTPNRTATGNTVRQVLGTPPVVRNSTSSTQISTSSPSVTNVNEENKKTATPHRPLLVSTVPQRTTGNIVRSAMGQMTLERLTKTKNIQRQVVASQVKPRTNVSIRTSLQHKLGRTPTIIKTVPAVKSAVPTAVRTLSSGQKITFSSNQGKLMAGGTNVILLSENNSPTSKPVIIPISSSSPSMVKMTSPSKTPRPQTRVMKTAQSPINKNLATKLPVKNTPIVLQRSALLRNRPTGIIKQKPDPSKPVVIPIIDSKLNTAKAGVCDVSYGDDGDSLSFPLDCDISDTIQGGTSENTVKYVIENKNRSPANKFSQVILTKSTEHNMKKLKTLSPLKNNQVILESASGERYVLEDESDGTEVVLDDQQEPKYIINYTNIDNEQAEVIYEIVDNEHK